MAAQVANNVFWAAYGLASAVLIVQYQHTDGHIFSDYPEQFIACMITLFFVCVIVYCIYFYRRHIRRRVNPQRNIIRTPLTPRFLEAGGGRPPYYRERAEREQSVTYRRRVSTPDPDPDWFRNADPLEALDAMYMMNDRIFTDDEDPIPPELKRVVDLVEEMKRHFSYPHPALPHMHALLNVIEKNRRFTRANAIDAVDKSSAILHHLNASRSDNQYILLGRKIQKNLREYMNAMPQEPGKAPAGPSRSP